MQGWKEIASAFSRRDKILIAIGLLIWFLLVIRYYPGQIGRSAWDTGIKIFWSSGLAAIFTRLLIRLLRWIEKTRPSWPRIAKIFLALAIAFAVMLGIEDYRRHYQPLQTPVSSLECRPLANQS